LLFKQTAETQRKKDTMIERLVKLVKLVEKELERDKSLMNDKDIYWDEGYIAGVEHAISVIQGEE
jgi:hypothetical protein